MRIIWAPPKYDEKSSASRVALIRISLSSGRRGRRSFRTISRKSAIKCVSHLEITPSFHFQNLNQLQILPSFIPRSWISSTITWVTPFKFLSTSNLLNKIPVVQKRRWVSLPFIPSNRTLYPTCEKGSQEKNNTKWISHKRIRRKKTDNCK